MELSYISFVEVGLLTALTAIQFRAEPGTVLMRRFSAAASLRLTRGFQLDLAIALNGVPAKIQPHWLFQPSRGFVETSDDVTEGTFSNTPDSRI
ncbi:MAG: hypothetical protein DME75_03445 [Verrucomicrobia bacterium]|nr:MAG: hypothetical protein DME75_03445 [Verrucomicrobiota bacterium]